MIDAVAIFALVTAVFEFLLLMKLSPRTRLRVLGHPGIITALVFGANLMIHWGTMTGSMTAVTAALSSIAVTALCRWIFGHISAGVYVAGVKRYRVEELV